MARVGEREVLDKIVLNENLYIYTKNSDRFYPKRTIENLFSMAKEDKSPQGCQALYWEVNSSKETSTEVPYKMSSLVLKYTNIPSFLVEFIDKWVEQKLSYLFVFDFGKFVMIFRRNISGIQSFLSTLNELDYGVIAKLFVTDETLFEKFSLQNLDISSKAMRSKSVESDSLTENYNYIGSNTYMLNHVRLNNDNQRYLLSLNTSRINKPGEKICLNELAQWCYELTQMVENFTPRESFIDNFATHCNYESERDSITPINVTILLTKLFRDIEDGKIIDVKYQKEGNLISLDISKRVTSLSLSTALTQDIDNLKSFNSAAFTATRFPFDLMVKIYEKSIRLSSIILSKIILYKSDDTDESLINYLNRHSCFVLNFDQCEYVYSNKKLFKDSNLLGNSEHFLKAFHPDDDLLNIDSEKGNITSTCTRFIDSCMFHYVENKYSTSDYLILDDLGDEWADHISISESVITFIHSKCSDSIYSATAFTDIIGQTQKNIGNIFSVDSAIRNKRGKWEAHYKLNNVVSQITRLRRGGSVNGFIDRYIETKLHPNSKRAVCLALNFISKQQLSNNIARLRANERFGQKKETIQILWFISSLIANCRDNSIDVKILCKP